MTLGLDTIIAAVEPLMSGRPESWWSEPWGPGKWQRRETLGHLIDSASNNHQRFVRALIQDSYEGPGYDQDACVRVERFAAAPVPVLVALFCSYNRLLAHVIAGFPPDKLATVCRVGTYPVTTLDELAIDYVAHLAHHLGQILGAEMPGTSARAWPRAETPV